MARTCDPPTNIVRWTGRFYNYGLSAFQYMICTPDTVLPPPPSDAAYATWFRTGNPTVVGNISFVGIDLSANCSGVVIKSGNTVLACHGFGYPVGTQQGMTASNVGRSQILSSSVTQDTTKPLICRCATTDCTVTCAGQQGGICCISHSFTDRLKLIATF